MTFGAPSHRAADDRYEKLGEYRRAGDSGLVLPAFSFGLWQKFGTDFGLWQKFGTDRPYATRRDIVLHAFDLGITHFDNANRYGPPARAAEKFFGTVLRRDLTPYRDELVLSTKAGNPLGPSPCLKGGSRKSLLASLDHSLRDLGTDYVDISYSHSPDLSTPLEETVGALVTAVRSGKALYAGISNYTPERAHEAAELLRRAGVPLLVHQPRHSIFDRTPELNVCWISPPGTASASWSTVRSPRDCSPTSISTARSLRAPVPATVPSCRPTPWTTPTASGPRHSTRSPGGGASRWRSWRCSGPCGSPR